METIDVMCINCEDLIPNLEIERHSKTCISPVSIESLFLRKNDLSPTNFKFKKIRKGLNRILKTVPTIFEKEAVKFMITTCDKLSSQEEITQATLQTTLSLQNTLKNYSFQNFNSVILTLYSERIKVIMKEKIKILNSSLIKSAKNLSQNSLDSLISVNNCTLAELEKEIELQKSLRSEFEKSLEKISNIGSIVDTNSKKSLHSRASSYGNSKDLDSFNFSKHSGHQSNGSIHEPESSGPQEDLEESRRKLFYSKVLISKLSFGSKHLAQLVQLSDLYKEVKQLNLTVDLWDGFISTQLNNPDRWLKKL